jgi:hypothetical protein
MHSGKRGTRERKMMWENGDILKTLFLECLSLTLREANLFPECLTLALGEASLFPECLLRHAGKSSSPGAGEGTRRRHMIKCDIMCGDVWV